MTTISHDYVARAECGCVVSICADFKDRFTAKFVAKEIKDGHTIERLPVDEAVEALKAPRCDKCATRVRRYQVDDQQAMNL